jgi:hypothetical protein
MFNFQYKGIEMAVVNRPELYEYEVEENKKRIGRNRNNFVSVKFWDFIIKDGDLFELARVKSWFMYFMQAYWKRSTKEGNRIDLSRTLTHEIANKEYATSTLIFNAVQQKKTSYLHICQKNDEEKIGEIYLSGDDVIMLDVAIGRCINLLSPNNDVGPVV